QHFVKELPNGDWRITVKGQLYRLTTHPQWIFVQLFIGAALAFIVGYSILIISRKPQATEQQPAEEKKKSTKPIPDSSLYKSAQNHTLKVKDSSASQLDTTKTRK